MTRDTPRDSPPGATLNIWERGGFALLGALGVFWSYNLFESSQVHRSTETVRNRNGDWTDTEKSGEVPRVTEPLAVLGLGTLALLLALNGRRVYRISIGDKTVDTELDKRKNDAAPVLDDQSIVKKLVEDLEPNLAAPVVSPSVGAELERDGHVYQVLGLYEVPSRVLIDAIVNWPAPDSPPTQAADLSFALRRKGRGNHAWLLQFKGQKELWVAYGGQNKVKPTVYFA